MYPTFPALTTWKTWLPVAAIGLASLASGAVSAATAIPAGPLVSTEWLSQNLDNPKVRVIEVSVNPGLYERAHVPGAVNFSWHNDLNDKVRRDIVGKSDAKLVDIRSADEYQGKVFAPAGVQELAIRAGHIPGAVNVPWGQAVKEDCTFKSPEDLKKLYAGVGIDGSKPVITYCRIGERSSHTWFALSKLLGYKVKNYDGSWTEYGNAVGVPITACARWA